MHDDCGLIRTFPSHTRELLNVLPQVHPEELGQVLWRDLWLDQSCQFPCEVSVVTRAPEEGRVHECSEDTDSRRRQAPLRSWRHSPGVRTAQGMTSLRGIITVQCKHNNITSIRLLQCGPQTPPDQEIVQN